MPNLLIVDDDASVRRIVTKCFDGSDVDVVAASSAEEGESLLQESANNDDAIDVILLDIMLPDVSGLEAISMYQNVDRRIPIIFVTSHGSSEVAIEAMMKGAYEYLVKPLDVPKLRELVARAAEIRRKMSVRVGVTQEDNSDLEGDSLIGASVPMQAVYKAIGRVASEDVTVLIQGESGTGKELIARAIYQHSLRSDQPFLAINCAAVPSTLLESELFGHEKGAFTGADSRRIGKFEQCDGGTIFLDEIGDMPTELQSKMLRLLQEQSFERVGGNVTIKTNVRIIAATNQDLEQLVEDDEFREDLYYRLKGFLICLPPLRDRGEDVVLLAQRFLKRYNRDLGKQVEWIAPETMKIMQDYPWPGNVRELENVVRQSIIQATGPALLPEFLPEIGCYDVPNMAEDAVESGGANDVGRFVTDRIKGKTSSLYAEVVEFSERILLPLVLQHTDGNQSRAATILGITRGSLRNKLKNLGISVEQVVSVESTDSPSENDSREEGCKPCGD
jgi:two-component system response regulator AtoC